MRGSQQMTADDITDAWLAGNIEAVRSDKLKNVVTIWLIYQRLKFIRGDSDTAAMEDNLRRLQQALAATGKKHLQQLLETWD